MYNDKLDNIVDKYNNTYHRTIKSRPHYNKSGTSNSFDVENNKGHKFKLGDHERMSKYKNIFSKVYTTNWSKNVTTKKVKNSISCAYLMEELNDEEIVGTIYEKEWQKINQTNFWVDK